MSNSKSLLGRALVAAKRAGEAILEVYNSDFAVEHKEDKSPLTEADKRAHQIILRHLLDPVSSPAQAIPILSEEGKSIPYSERKTWETFWLVDPLDGTKEFVKRNGEFTVNIALIEKCRPILGVIYVPVKDFFYYGVEGLGAYKLFGAEKVGLSGEQEAKALDGAIFSGLVDDLILESNPLPLNGLLPRPFTVVSSRSHMSKETEEYITELRERHGEIEMISAGSSLKLCLVAEGRADVYPRFAPTMEWDTGAGQAIVEQSGGKVLDANTHNPLRYNKENLLNPWFIAESNFHAKPAK